jgi:hypothetical protein
MQSDYDYKVSEEVQTFPITGTTMTYDPNDNSLNVVHTGGETVYSSGSVLRISINANDEYEIEDPGQAISAYSYNKQLSHSNLMCFVVQQRSGIGVTDFRDFRIKDTWSLDACAIGLDLSDRMLKVGFDSNTPPCYIEVEDKNATCS